MFLWHWIQLSQEFSNVVKKCHQELNFVPQHLLPMPPSWGNKVCEVVVVRWCTYFLVPVLQAGYIVVIVQPWINFFSLTQIVFNSLSVHLHLVYNVALRNHIEEKRDKFKRSRINQSPSHCSFDTGVKEFTQTRRRRLRERHLKCNLVFLQSFLNNSKSLRLLSVF